MRVGHVEYDCSIMPTGCAKGNPSATPRSDRQVLLLSTLTSGCTRHPLSSDARPFSGHPAPRVIPVCRQRHRRCATDRLAAGDAAVGRWFWRHSLTLSTAMDSDGSKATSHNCKGWSLPFQGI